MRELCPLLLAACLGCTQELPPYGEALVVVDTDLPLRLAQQLRVDGYRADGRWLESRDIAVHNDDDWPVSFGLQAPAEGRDSEVLLRLRAYPTGRVRDFRGLRFEDKPTFEPMRVAHSLDDACADPETIAPGEARWVRFGADKLVDALHGGDCDTDSGPDDTDGDLVTDHISSRVGSAVLRVDIAERATYRFAVLDTLPPADPQISLQLRQSCASEDVIMGCSAGLPTVPETIPPHTLPRLELELDPGTYYLVSASGDYTYFGIRWDAAMGPTDMLVGVGRVDRWDQLETVDNGAPWAWRRETLETTSELVPGGPEHGTAPTLEPEPAVTVDRLVRVPLRYGERRQVRVTLHGACADVMADLGNATPFDPPDLAAASTCVATAGKRELVPIAAHLQPADPPALGSFPPAQPCDAQGVAGGAVCVPGGVFLLGALFEANGSDLQATRPERLAVVSRFWIDQHEVTVGRWREAVGRGFTPPAPEDGPLAHDAPLGATDDPSSLFADPNFHPNQLPALYASLCSYSSSPIGREDYAVSCLSWAGARAFCEFHGGDLPSAAQWEYVATAAARDNETRFPWGDDLPVCTIEECEGEEACHAIASKRSRRVTHNQCLEPRSPSYGPLPVTAFADPVYGDATVQLNEHPDAHVYNLAGGLTEYVLDSFHPYASRCWRAASLVDPMCWEEEAAVREGRGTYWGFGDLLAYGAYREMKRGASAPRYFRHPSPLQGMGFRCVYREAPAP